MENPWNLTFKSAILCPSSAKETQMGVPRSEPYIWATWLTSLLVGEASCEWGAWFKAHHQSYDKVPDTFDQTKWQMDHTVLLREIPEKLDPQYTIFLEDQNRFRLPGKASSIVVGGKPDLIAVKGDHGLICDAKTGQPRPSDHVQVMIYMWATPLAFRQYRTMKFEGKVVYREHEVPIPASAVDDLFVSNLGKLIRRIGASASPPKVPSAMECGFCRIASTECPERVEQPEGEQTEGPSVDLY